MRSVLLVIGQFICIALLLLGGDLRLPWWSWSLFGLGCIIFLLAAASLGRINFTVMPAPRPRSELSVRGIYRHLRHPMYTAVLICGLAVTAGSPTPVRLVALVMCTIVLIVKVLHEERLLTLRHPSYPHSMKGVARLFPGIW